MVVQTSSAVYTHVPLIFTGGKRRVLRVHHLRLSRAEGLGVPELQGSQASSDLQLGPKLTQAVAASSFSKTTPPPKLPLELWVELKASEECAQVLVLVWRELEERNR